MNRFWSGVVAGLAIALIVMKVASCMTVDPCAGHIEVAVVEELIEELGKSLDSLEETMKEPLVIEDPEAETSEIIEDHEVRDPQDCPSISVPDLYMDRVMAALVDHSNKGKFILWDDDYGNEDNDPNNVRVVYEYKGVRYTVWHSPPYLGGPSLTASGFLSVWERPVGSHDDDSVDTYSDTEFTGCANFGIGSEALHGSDRRLMRWEHALPSEGLAHHAFWQVRFETAIEGLAHVLGL